MKVIAIFFLFLCSAPAPAYASEGVEDRASTGRIDPDKTFNELDLSEMSTAEAVRKLLMALGIVAVMGAGAFYVSRKAIPGLSRAGSRDLQLVESVSLGARKQVHIVRAGRRKFLLGSSPDGLNYLADVTEALPEANDSSQSAGAVEDE